ncbi:MAG: TlyA family RNA methyltransferase [Actinomycetales bacterium]
MTRRRLDAEVARRGLARSRQHAQVLIAAGSVAVKGVIAVKPATMVDDADAIDVRVSERAYVSRGAHKLIGALDALVDLHVGGRLALDAGASTGGFTEVLLQRGVSAVLAMDVGYGQLAWSLRQDPRVVVVERSNVRYATRSDLPWIPNLVVADLSFISLKTVLPALLVCSAEQADLVLLVKPQFEVGREHVADGVVRDPALRQHAVMTIAEAVLRAGHQLRAIVASPLPGPRGNVEYFLWATKDGAHVDGSSGSRWSADQRRASALVEAAIEAGPR